MELNAAGRAPDVDGGAAAPDWEAIKRDYERGFEPLTALSARHGVNYRAVSRMAYLHKWRRLALQGADAHAVEQAVGAMTMDVQRALKRHVTRMDRAVVAAMKDKTATERFTAAHEALKGLSTAIRLIEKLGALNESAMTKIETLRGKDGGDDPLAALERRLFSGAAP